MKLSRTLVDSLNAAKRTNSVLTGSRYKQGIIPSENMKFEHLCSVLFKSDRMTDEQRHTEIVSYVRDMETRYNEIIDQLKTSQAKSQKQILREKTKV